MNKQELNTYIFNKINNNNLENTILFYGEEKDDFFNLILDYSKIILCIGSHNKEEKIEKILNGKCDCDSCKEFNNLDKNTIVQDLKIFKKEEQSEKSDIKIGEIKEFFVDIKYKPKRVKKVYIIDGAESLNINAQNAILKIIEEPPAGTYIFLIATHLDNLLPTIRSRCTKIFLKQKKDINESDNNKNIEQNKSKKLEEFLKSDIGKPLENIFIDALNLDKLRYISKYDKLIDKKNIKYILDNLQDLFEYSLNKNKKINLGYRILLEINKKCNFNLNNNILKTELILGIYNFIKKQYIPKKNDNDILDRIYE